MPDVNFEIASLGRSTPAAAGGELLAMRNRDVDWKNQWITIRAQNAKDFENRNVAFEADGRLAQLLQRRCFSARTPTSLERHLENGWVASALPETVLLLAHGHEPVEPTGRDTLIRYEGPEGN
jgi:integrase